MGGGSYERDVTPRRSGQSTSDVRREVFSHSESVSRSVPGRRGVHKDLNINGKNRECCDSSEHPETNPIVIAMDVTKSRGDDAVAIFEKMPLLVGQCIMTGIAPQPVVSICAFGDATCGDYAPIQISQFESDTRIDKALKKVWLEEGGGGTGQESAELVAYYYARHSVLDANKRGVKGDIFFLSDEGFYPQVSQDQIKVWIGDDIEKDIPAKKIFAELQKMYDVYLINPASSLQKRMGNIDAEIATRVRNAGGMIEGVSIRASLIWYCRNDLDLHIICPSGEEIYYSHMKSRCGGFLDVDMNVGGETTKPVENIRWKKGKAPKGSYRVFVRNYDIHGNCAAATNFRVELEIDGKVQHFEGTTPKDKTGHSSDVICFEFDYDPSKGLVEPEDKYALYEPKVITAQWASVIPKSHIFPVNDARACVDVMLGAMAISKGIKTLPEYLEDLKGRDQTSERCADVENALSLLSKTSVTSDVDSDAFSKKRKSGRVRSKQSRRI